MDPPQTPPDRPKPAPTPLLRPGLEDRHNGVVFTGASSVTVTRYRYRGANIPTPWTPTATSG